MVCSSFLFKEKWVALVYVGNFPPWWGNRKRQWPIHVNYGICNKSAVTNKTNYSNITFWSRNLSICNHKHNLFSTSPRPSSLTTPWSHSPYILCIGRCMLALWLVLLLLSWWRHKVITTVHKWNYYELFCRCNPLYNSFPYYMLPIFFLSVNDFLEEFPLYKSV